MLPVNLSPCSITKSQIPAENKPNHRYQHKQRVLTHQSLKNTKSLHSAEGTHRSNSSEARYDSRSHSVQKSVSSKNKPIRMALSP